MKITRELVLLVFQENPDITMPEAAEILCVRLEDMLLHAKELYDEGMIYPVSVHDAEKPFVEQRLDAVPRYMTEMLQISEKKTPEIP